MRRANLFIVIALTLLAALAWVYAGYQAYFLWRGLVFSSYTTVLACSLTFAACVGWAVVTFGPGRGDGETRCRKCGYILRGISEPRCPECGEVI